MPSAVEICVIFAEPTFYLEEQVLALKALSDPGFTVLYVPDRPLPEPLLGKISLDGRFRVVPSGKAAIPSKRNFCVRNLRPETRWAAFMDDDAYPPPGWLASLKEAIRLNPEARILGAPSLPPPGTRLAERAVGLVTESWIGLGEEALWHRPIRSARVVGELPCSNLVIDRSLFAKEDALFNEAIHIGEDVEWCHRMRDKHRETIRLFPGHSVYHHSRPLWKPACLQFFRYGSYRMRVTLFQKKFTPLELVKVMVPAGFTLLPPAALWSAPARILLIFYFLCIIIEGIFQRKSPVEHALRLLAVPLVHFCYGLGLFARLVRFPTGEAPTYVRAETLPPNPPGPEPSR